MNEEEAVIVTETERIDKYRNAKKKRKNRISNTADDLSGWLLYNVYLKLYIALYYSAPMRSDLSSGCRNERVEEGSERRCLCWISELSMRVKGPFTKELF